MPSAKAISRPSVKHTDEMTLEELTAWAASDDTSADLADSAPAWRGTFAQSVKRTRGRPPRGAAPKVLKSVRFDPDVISGLQELGPDWQQRMNDMLRERLTEPASRA